MLLSTHYMAEADELCDRLAIIDGGRIRVLGSPSELKAGLGGDIVSLTIGAEDAGRIEALATALRVLPMVRAVTAKPSGLDIRVESSEKALPAVLEAANRTSCRLELVDYHRPRLDDVFVAHTGHAIRSEFPEEDNV